MTSSMRNRTCAVNCSMGQGTRDRVLREDDLRAQAIEECKEDSTLAMEPWVIALRLITGRIIKVNGRNKEGVFKFHKGGTAMIAEGLKTGKTMAVRRL